MTKQLLLLVALLLWGVANAAELAIVKITPTNSEKKYSGSVAFEASDTNVELTFNLQGFEPNSEHAVHIHEFGDISGTETQGGHYNPTKKTHACHPDPERHVGDLGNLKFDETGSLTDLKMTRDLASLNVEQAGLIIGRALVIHAAADNCSAPVGFAGSRIAHGVIGWNSAVSTPATSNEVPANTQYVCLLSAVGDNGIHGNITFRQSNNSEELDVLFFIEGLNKSTVYSIVIHEYGNINNDQALSVGANFNPGAADRCKPPTPDNLDSPESLSDGRIYKRITFKAPSVISMAPDSKYSILGRSVVVDAQKYDCTATEPSHLAQCVIGTSQARVFALDNPSLYDFPSEEVDNDDQGWFSISGWGVGMLVVVVFCVAGASGYLLLRWRSTGQTRQYGAVPNTDHDDFELGEHEEGESIELDTTRKRD